MNLWGKNDALAVDDNSYVRGARFEVRGDADGGALTCALSGRGLNLNTLMKQ